MTVVDSRPPIDLRERAYTVEDLAELPSELPSGPVRYEIDNGRLISMAPPGDQHAAAECTLAFILKTYGERRGHGKARSGDVGIILWRDPDRVVGADAAFIASRSLPIRRSREGYLETMPDLVAEVVSKNDTAAYTQRKAEDYLEAGVQIVWVADPVKRTITVYRRGAEPVVLGEGDTLTAGEIIPDLAVPVAEVFEE